MVKDNHTNNNNNKNDDNNSNSNDSYLKNFTVPLSVYPLGSDNVLTILILILLVNNHSFSYFIAILLK